MSGAVREKDAADYDLERFVEMFDQAMVSNDPRVKNALRQLMMMVILTDEGDDEAGMRASKGPLHRMQEDMRDHSRWIQRLEYDIQELKRQVSMNQNSKQAVEQQSRGWPKDFDPYYATDAITTAELKDAYQQVMQRGVNISPQEFSDLNININGSLFPEDSK